VTSNPPRIFFRGCAAADSPPFSTYSTSRRSAAARPRDRRSDADASALRRAAGKRPGVNAEPAGEETHRRARVADEDRHLVRRHRLPRPDVSSR
jgi:hypothetical protein